MARLHRGEMINRYDPDDSSELPKLIRIIRVFVTTRGDGISRLHGHYPQLSWTGSGPYPRIDEVHEQ